MFLCLDLTDTHVVFPVFMTLFTPCHYAHAYALVYFIVFMFALGVYFK